jgi:hypothetical protein
MVDYEADISANQHKLKVVKHLYDSSRPCLNGLGDFDCEFGDGNRTVRVDLMSGSVFPDNFDYSTLVGKYVSVSHTFGYLFIANDTEVLPEKYEDDTNDY